MRKAFTDALVKYLSPARCVFLTGDLGFMALEGVRNAMQSRFINAGVAEQNMISVAAGLAKTGLSVWVYSIAPFCYARPFEQIRNDVCLHALPVRLVGNGGGYGYGVMGSTHHAIEDYGVLLTLPGMRAFVPAFDCDLDPIVARMETEGLSPAYLRLGLCELPAGFAPPAYAPWRRLLRGKGPVIIVVGPLAGNILKRLIGLDEALRPDLWVVTELPLHADHIPADFIASLKSSPGLWLVEEHVAQGSFGHMVAAWILERSFPMCEFRHFTAKGYPSRRMGSQAFHRKESGIDGDSILQALLVREQSGQRN
ncbi:MAG: transketolase [Bryobacteraceae bacterium]|jgi:transketolase